MLNQILQSLAGIEQAVQSGGEGLNQQGQVLQAALNTPGAPLTPGLDVLDRFRLLENITLRQSTPAIVVNVPTDFNTLLLVYTARTDRPASVTDSIGAQFNGDTGANYHYQFILGATSGITYSPVTGAIFAFVGQTTGSTATANHFGHGLAVITGLQNRAAFTGMMSIAGRIPNTTTTNFTCTLGQAHWSNVAVVKTLTLYPVAGPNFVAGSQFTVWGLK